MKKALIAQCFFTCILVPRVGIEPTRLSAEDFESSVYTSFTTEAKGTTSTSTSYSTPKRLLTLRETKQIYTSILLHLRALKLLLRQQLSQ